MTNDFKVKRYHNSYRKGELWQVYCGRTITHIITRTEQEAIEYAKILNKDPWYFEKKAWNRFKEQRT
jgi:hypothetical protein